MTSPFSKTSDRPGQGVIALKILPPVTPVLHSLSYQYPLKLIAPSPIDLTTTVPPLPTIKSQAPSIVHTVFILTYGGGLLPNDHVSLNVSIAPGARLVLLTQGSTKIFKSEIASTQQSLNSFPVIKEGGTQCMVVEIADGAALCYLPDPIQPFADSAFEQRQTFNLSGNGTGNLCICDWVCEGRPARGESWSFQRYVSLNEIWVSSAGEMKQPQESEIRKRLMLRDKVMLDRRSHIDVDYRAKVNRLGVVGTLILRGKLFDKLGQFFLDEFQHLPRIGGRVWESGEKEDVEDSIRERNARHEREAGDGLLWTAAASRGSVIVKFGARNAEGARRWLGHMLKLEGTIETTFGEGALLCLR
ncbi:urease accessory protein-like protein UreD [Viridothelium virens]|uniref:Urease accessory protein-like protein UreD n=1 Tax=Viridothelium virens TaxID=1048519 RepID=A0A6A6HLQ2_VIRVR|nr:urease accessory protein-like protein UreD [Viridothelium virens]